MDLMNRVFCPYLDRIVIVFIDNILSEGPLEEPPSRGSDLEAGRPNAESVSSSLP